jgi:hypothetical protein
MESAQSNFYYVEPSLPTPKILGEIPELDKAAHFAVYGVLGVMIMTGLTLKEDTGLASGYLFSHHRRCLWRMPSGFCTGKKCRWLGFDRGFFKRLCTVNLDFCKLQLNKSRNRTVNLRDTK